MADLISDEPRASRNVYERTAQSFLCLLKEEIFTSEYFSIDILAESICSRVSLQVRTNAHLGTLKRSNKDSLRPDFP